MTKRSPAQHWSLWVFAAALLLKSAMPWLASVSAEMQGRSLIEVCSVHGVSLVPLNNRSHGPSQDHGSAQKDAHCALSAFSALATGDSPAPAEPPAQLADVAPVRAHLSSLAPDAIQVNVRAGQLPPPDENGVAYLRIPLNALPVGPEC